MKISWLVLTYNRADKVKQAMEHNIANRGCDYDELVWVDNGSTDSTRDVMPRFCPDIAVLHRTNLGVAKGYNRAMALSSGDYLVITGCDMLMPDNWLKTFRSYVETIANTGIACMYHKKLSEVGERKRKNIVDYEWNRQVIDGLPIVHAMPIERRIFSRDLLSKIGFLREDFGLYGWEDVEWAHRAERVCDENRLLYYVIPDQRPIHLGTEGINHSDGKDESGYHAFKQREARDPRKLELLNQCKQRNWPYYNPFP